MPHSSSIVNLNSIGTLQSAQVRGSFEVTLAPADGKREVMGEYRSPRAVSLAAVFENVAEEGLASIIFW